MPPRCRPWLNGCSRLVRLTREAASRDELQHAQSPSAVRAAPQRLIPSGRDRASGKPESYACNSPSQARHTPIDRGNLASSGLFWPCIDPVAPESLRQSGRRVHRCCSSFCSCGKRARSGAARPPTTAQDDDQRSSALTSESRLLSANISSLDGSQQGSPQCRNGTYGAGSPAAHHTAALRSPSGSSGGPHRHCCTGREPAVHGRRPHVAASCTGRRRPWLLFRPQTRKRPCGRAARRAANQKRGRRGGRSSTAGSTRRQKRARPAGRRRAGDRVTPNEASSRSAQRTACTMVRDKSQVPGAAVKRRKKKLSKAIYGTSHMRWWLVWRGELAPRRP
jgi:hypothetical protein